MAVGATTSIRNRSIRPEIREVFVITRLDRLFHIKEDESEAVAAFY